jgi:hypothetical protein
MMRRALLTAGLLVMALAGAGGDAGAVNSRHGTLIDHFTTKRPGAPSGFHFVGRYHAAGDPDANPPYMRGMTFYSPPGLRYDTSVPDRCTAGNARIALLGPKACPPGSRLGGGTANGVFMNGFANRLDLDFFNARDEQIIVARSPLVASVSRGRIRRDGAVEWHSPTCYPTGGVVGCPVDNALQVSSDVTVKPYTRGGRSYMTTPPSCPRSGSWRLPIRLWWADGTVDTVVTKQACTR